MPLPYLLRILPAFLHLVVFATCFSGRLSRVIPLCSCQGRRRNFFSGNAAACEREGVDNVERDTYYSDAVLIAGRRVGLLLPVRRPFHAHSDACAAT